MPSLSAQPEGQHLRSAEAIQRSDDRMRELIEGTDDLIMTAGVDGRFLYVNRAWREALERGEAEIALLGPLVDTAGHLIEAHRTGEAKARADRSLREGETRLRAIHDAAGDAILTVPEDGLLTTGVTGDLPEPARELVDIAHKNSERLVRLVTDILDIERLGAGQMSFRMAPVDAGEIVSETVAANRGLAQTAGVVTYGMLRDAGSEAPIVFMSACVRTEDRARLLAIGGAGVIAKPFDPRTSPPIFAPFGAPRD